MQLLNTTNSRIFQLLLLTTLAASTAAIAAEDINTTAEKSTDANRKANTKNITSDKKDTQLEIELLHNELAIMREEHQRKIDELSNRLQALAKQESEANNDSNESKPDSNQSENNKISLEAKSKSANKSKVQVDQTNTTKESSEAKSNSKKLESNETANKKLKTKTNQALSESSDNESQPKTGLGANEVVIDAAYMEKYNMNISPVIEQTTKPLPEKQIEEVGQTTVQTKPTVNNSNTTNKTSNINKVSTIKSIDSSSEEQKTENTTNNKEKQNAKEDGKEIEKKAIAGNDSESNPKPEQSIEESSIKKDAEINTSPNMPSITDTTEKNTSVASESDSTQSIKNNAENLHEPPAKPFIPNKQNQELSTTETDLELTGKDETQSTTSQPVITVDTTATPSEIYLKALQAFSAARTAEAIAFLERYIKNYPNEPLISKAHFWLGEAYLQKEPANYAASRFEFLEVVNRYANDPNNDKRSKALFRLTQLSKINNYDDELERYVDMLKVEYPNAEETKLAIELLKHMKESRQE